MEVKFRTLRPDEIECRVKQITKDYLVILLYKNSRVDMDLLDETVGPMNWRRGHCRENANCIVSIYDTDKKEWVPKEDTGTESNTEAEKGLASDSFKRACVNWGIGRELYSAPRIRVRTSECKVEQGKNGKTVCRDSFTVSAIHYNDARKIDQLELTNNRTGNVVFRFPAAPKQPDKQPDKPTPPAPPPAVVKCKDCGQPIKDVEWANGKKTSAEKMVNQTIQRYGVALCGDCYTLRRAKEQTDGNQG
nr:MAG TPA: Rad52/22 family double-strand break repair protein [Caudoviricetes sp.]